jgi:hypothetical protein
MRSSGYLCVCEFPQLTYECLNQSFSNLVRILRHLSQSQRHTSLFLPPRLCARVCNPPFVARQRLGKHVRAVKNARNNRRIAGRVPVAFCIPLPLLDNSIKTFPRKQRIVGVVVFYAVRVVGDKFFTELSVLFFKVRSVNQKGDSHFYFVIVACDRFAVIGPT